MVEEIDFFNFSYFDVNQSLTNATTSRINATEPWKFVLPVWRQVLWFVLFAATVTVGTVGNGLVIWIVWSNKNMRTVTNYPLVNLAVSDTITLTLNTIFNFYAMLHNEWFFGEYCIFAQFISSLCISVSVFTLMAISIDRYLALVVDVTRGPPSKRATFLVGAAIWSSSAIISVPALITYKYTPGNATEKSKPVCATSAYYSQSLIYFYDEVFAILTFVVPMGCMIYSYRRVGNVLWGSERIRECIDARQFRIIEDRKRMVLMMIVVVILFALSWPPLQLYFVVIKYYPDLSAQDFVQEMYLGFYWLAMSHSAYHPIMYWCFLKKNGFKKSCRRWCCCSREEVNHRESSGWSLSVLSSRRNGSNTSTRRPANGSFEIE